MNSQLFYVEITNVIIVPTGSVTYSQSPSSGTLYTTDALNLTCVTTYPNYQAVDIPVRVQHRYFDSRSQKLGETIMYTSHLMPKYSSTLLIGSLHSNHSGVHSCSSEVHPFNSSIFIVDNATEQTAYIRVEIGRCVTSE